jgi:hypothetical protein
MATDIRQITLVSRPGHRATIDIAEDDGDAEAARCNCGCEWHQCDGPFGYEWYSTHLEPTPTLTGTILRARATGTNWPRPAA